ncbi:hypothetical protein [Piscinibacter gummiphilus]|uniref:Uncharacterized protein n=1 Tax=Piscinibacter gummiphilus TaxID=946333 RepID=A0ABZ0CNP0_9BURK|nr:hypothetical protein [Piscinibacter gummiphilus]WOB06504.1 hypothetical protein RXV79_16400 [Piscinibacter gummiphilus]
MSAQHTPGPLPESVAVEWEATARSLRIEARRARNYESRQIHLRDAADAEAFAARIRAARAAIAKAGGAS